MLAPRQVRFEASLLALLLLLLLLSLGADAFSASSSSSAPRPQPESPHQRGPIATTTPTTTKPMQFHSGMRELIDQYDLFLLDMWGVLHDGSAAYPGVLDCLEQLVSQQQEPHKKAALVVLSNSSKRQDHSIRMLTKLGFDPNRHFQPIITSGEVTWNLLAGVHHPTTTITENGGSTTSRGGDDAQSWLEQYCGGDGDTAKNVFVLGSGDGDVEYCHSCGWTVTTLAEARLILARGTFTIHSSGGANDADAGTVVQVHRQRDGAAAYDTALRECLAQAATRQLPMLLANPDKIRPDADRSPMPGYLADLYAVELLRQHGAAESDDNGIKNLIRRVGKPFPDVYDLVLEKYYPDIPKSRILMVGDALETDVVGGTRAGIDTAWVVLDGIHSPDLSEEDLEASCQRVLEQFNARSQDTYAEGQQLLPTYVLPHFVW